MRVAIIEDELFAYKELERMLLNIEPEIQILAHFESVAEAINGLPDLELDLLFLDISLPDGFSFEILNKVNVDVPIIFTTAYDEYAVKAFKFNSVDYLLKPVDEEDLTRALHKFKKLSKKVDDLDYSRIANLLEHKRSKKRFLIRTGDR